MGIFDKIRGIDKQSEIVELKKDIQALTEFSASFQVTNQQTYNLSINGLSSADFDDEILVKLWSEVPEISTVLYQITSRAKSIPWGHFKITDKNKYSKFQKTFAQYINGKTGLDEVIKLRDESLKPVYDKEIKGLLDNPNEMQTWGDMIEQMINYYYVLGNSYIIKLGDFGFIPDEINVMPSQQTDVVIKESYIKDPYQLRKKESKISHYVFDNGFGKKITYAPELILHTKAANIIYKNGAWRKGYSPLASAIIASKTLRQEYITRLSQVRDQGMTGMLTADGKSQMAPTEEETDQLYKRLQKFGLGDGKKNSYAVTNAAFKWVNMVHNSKQLELLDGRIANLKVIARKMNVPTDLIIGESTFNNVNAGSKIIYTSNIIPYLGDLQNRINPFLGLTKRGEVIMPIYDNVAELQQELKTQSEIYGGLYNNGIATKEEARVGVNLPPETKGVFKETQTNNNKVK